MSLEKKIGKKLKYFTKSETCYELGDDKELLRNGKIIDLDGTNFKYAGLMDEWSYTSITVNIWSPPKEGESRFKWLYRIKDELELIRHFPEFENIANYKQNSNDEYHIVGINDETKEMFVTTHIVKWE